MQYRDIPVTEQVEVLSLVDEDTGLALIALEAD
jgi:hypothetical protein